MEGCCSAVQGRTLELEQQREMSAWDFKKLSLVESAEPFLLDTIFVQKANGIVSRR